jgi:hypothetical protein
MAAESSKRWWFGIAAVGLVAALAFVALAREPVLLDSDTPEGVVQRYLQAVSDSDYEMAFGYLDPEYYEGCDSTALARSAPEEPFTASIEDGEKTSTDHPLVPVTLHFGTGGGPFGSGWTTYEQFELVKVSGAWLITNEVWPYFSWDCRKDI